MRALLAAVAMFSPLALLAAEAPAEKAPPKVEPPKAEAPKEAKLVPGTYAHLKTARGEIVIRLLGDKAPKAVANFTELAKGERPWKTADGRWVAKPFYDGLTFHRIENDVLKLIQGGAPVAGNGLPKGDGSGGPGYKLDDETTKDLKFDKPGMVGMEKAESDTHGSQFFITLAPAPSLDGQHTIFGEVVKGIDVAEAISRLPSKPHGTGANVVHIAVVPVAIQSVSIEEVKDTPKPPAAPKAQSK